jgi:hypothetical protein
MYRRLPVIITYNSSTSIDDLEEIPLMGDNIDDSELLMLMQHNQQSMCNRLFTCFTSLSMICRRRKPLHSRTIRLGHGPILDAVFAPNVVRNQKYNILSFVPLVGDGFFNL